MLYICKYFDIMIKAINEKGVTTEFTEIVWNLMAPHKNGWKELKEGQTAVNIPDQIIEFQASKKVEIPEQPGNSPEIPEGSGEEKLNEVLEMKKYLDSKGIKYHPAIGYEKLKMKYDANKE